MTRWNANDMRAYAWPVLAAVVLLVALNAAINPSFLDPANWASILGVAVPFVITALAQAAPVLSGNGGLDLSVGPLAGLTNAVLVAVLIANGWTDPVVIIAATLAVGALAGALNGFLVAVVRVQPIIATLGTFVAFQGLTLHILPTAGGTAPDWLRALAGRVGVVPGSFVVLGAIAIAWLALGQGAFRRNLLAVGGDDRAAFTAGIDVTAVRFAAYVMSGILAAIAGLAFTAVLGSADPLVGTSYTLTSIAAVALGGVALSGGRGGLLGAGAGGALLFLVQNLLMLAQISIFFLQVAYGVILLVALAANAFGEAVRRNRASASG